VRVVDDATEQRPSAASLAIAPFIVATLPQVLVWLFVMGGMDGGFLFTVYSLTLAGYWGIIGLAALLSVLTRRRAAWIVATTGWLPPLACVLWLLYRTGFLHTQ
jgi:hypothetical protein